MQRNIFICVIILSAIILIYLSCLFKKTLRRLQIHEIFNEEPVTTKTDLEA